MNSTTINTIIATGGPLGYYTGGGTLMSLATLVIIIGIYHYVPFLYIPYLMILTIGGYHSIKKIIGNYRDKDPQIIVIDESIGMSIACCYIPLEWYYFVLAFILFRFFDICKPLGIRAAEDMGSAAVGIIADDVLAGLYTFIIVQIIRHIVL